MRQAEDIMHIRITLFDQETAERNYAASIKRETKLEAIKNLMETLKLSAKDAMSVLSIPLDQQPIYAAQL